MDRRIAPEVHSHAGGRSRAGRALLATLAVLTMLGACGDAPADAAADSKAATQAATTAPSANPAPAPAELARITHAEWQEKLRSYAPEIVVVDFWATWCTPCIERFPKMIAMAERYRGRGVRFVSMCMEDRDDRPAVAGAERFLAEEHSPLDDFLLDEPLLEGFEDFGLLSVPAVYVYDRSGTLHTRLTADDPRRQFDEGDVESALEALLSQ